MSIAKRIIGFDCFRRERAELTSRAATACLERARHSKNFTDGAGLALNGRSNR